MGYSQLLDSASSGGLQFIGPWNGFECPHLLNLLRRDPAGELHRAPDVPAAAFGLPYKLDGVGTNEGIAK